jgi:NADPH:quinone reductase-like Zn-dependent oxidoreductase
MRSVTHSTFGDPAVVLELTDTPVPEPKAGEVRIRMVLSPLHNHDLLTVAGLYGYKPELPAIGGTEAMGRIDALGEDVSGFEIGQRVTIAGVHGAWAEYFVAPAAQLVPLPDAISDEVGAQLIAMPLSAVALIEFLGVKAGDWIIQNAANGAVGKVLAMVAKTRGIHTVNLVRRDDGVAELAALGIDNAVSTANPGWQDKVRAIVGDAPVAAGVDAVGGKSSGDLLSLVGENGVLASFGAMSGEPMQISPADLIFKQVTVKGFWFSKVAGTLAPADMGRMVGELVQLAASRKLRLDVEGIFDLADAKKAAAASAVPGRKGKVLLRG